MLDKKSKKVLKILNKNKNDYNEVDCSQSLLKYLPKKYTEDSLNDVLWNLHDLDYITCSAGDDTIGDINILYKGQIYKELTWIQIKMFLIKSVLTPIIIACIVAFLTTLITLKLNSTKNQNNDYTCYTTDYYWCNNLYNS